MFCNSFVVPVYKKDEADTFEVKVDVAEVVQQASANDASLTKLNLNNHDEVTSDHLSDISRAMLTNNHVTHLQLVNTGFTDAHVQVLYVTLNSVLPNFRYRTATGNFKERILVSAVPAVYKQVYD